MDLDEARDVLRGTALFPIIEGDMAEATAVVLARLDELEAIAHRARVARGAQWVADEDRYVVNYILDNTIPDSAGVAVQED